ncbi:MAG: hypothetical protein ACW9W3_06455 [Candidatus Nitrosopumilus sp. bin_68KS]
MKTRLLIIIIPILTVFFIVGWNGVEVEETITKEQCSIDYDYYYVEPVIKNALECNNPFVTVEPCGTDSRLRQHNVQVDIIQCLCKDIAKNDSTITDYYNNEFDRYYENEIPSNDSEFVCKDGAKSFFRL